MKSHSLLQQVCSIPTAPFVEGRVQAFVERFVSEREPLRLSRDSTGNLLIELTPRGGRRAGSTPRWVFAAHMDHPGMVAEIMSDEATLEARFHGGVLIEYVQGARVVFFNSDGREIAGTVVEVTPAGKDRPTCPGRVRVRVKGPVEAGAPGMFALGEARVRGRRLYSRAIDDLGGVASALAMLDKLYRNPPADVTIAVLLTRAEEEGFIGAIAAARKPELLRKSDRIISIETSAQQAYAPMGKGVVIRIGDRTSIFDSALTWFITDQAQALARKSKAFASQRALMPGGTCEATVYDLYGFTAAAVCVPLGNYHNMDKEKGRLGAEYIDLRDWDHMVKLFVHLARTAGQFDPANPQLRERIEKRFKALAKYL